MKLERASWSLKRTLRGYLWLASALIVCPCHLPLLVALASGTAWAALLQANWNLAVALLTGYVLVALFFAYQTLAGGGSCSVPELGRNPVFALVLSASLPGLGQAYNRQWLKAAMLFLTGAASAWPLLRPARPGDSVASLAIWLLLPTVLLAAVEIGSMVDAYRVARVR